MKIPYFIKEKQMQKFFVDYKETLHSHLTFSQFFDLYQFKIVEPEIDSWNGIIYKAQVFGGLKR